MRLLLMASVRRAKLTAGVQTLCGGETACAENATTRSGAASPLIALAAAEAPRDRQSRESEPCEDPFSLRERNCRQIAGSTAHEHSHSFRFG
jgi:hypothetical protein